MACNTIFFRFYFPFILWLLFFGYGCRKESDVSCIVIESYPPEVWMEKLILRISDSSNIKCSKREIIKDSIDLYAGEVLEIDQRTLFHLVDKLQENSMEKIPDYYFQGFLVIIEKKSGENRVYVFNQKKSFVRFLNYLRESLSKKEYLVFDLWLKSFERYPFYSEIDEDINPFP